MVHQKKVICFEGAEGLKGCFGSSGILLCDSALQYHAKKCRSSGIIPCLTYTTCSSCMAMSQVRLSGSCHFGAQGNPPTGRDLRLRQALVRRPCLADLEDFSCFRFVSDKSDKWWKCAFFMGNLGIIAFALAGEAKRITTAALETATEECQHSSRSIETWRAWQHFVCFLMPAATTSNFTSQALVPE